MSTRTNVIGFKNSNTWPLSISISEYNMTIPVAPKDYVRDKEGQIVNDPVLEKYVGRGMLTKEVGQKAVPLLRLAAPAASSVPVSGHAGLITPGAMSPVRQAAGF